MRCRGLQHTLHNWMLLKLLWLAGSSPFFTSQERRWLHHLVNVTDGYCRSSVHDFFWKLLCSVEFDTTHWQSAHTWLLKSARLNIYWKSLGPSSTSLAFSLMSVSRWRAAVTCMKLLCSALHNTSSVSREMSECPHRVWAEYEIRADWSTGSRAGLWWEVGRGSCWPMATRLIFPFVNWHQLVLPHSLLLFILKQDVPHGWVSKLGCQLFYTLYADFNSIPFVSHHQIFYKATRLLV